MANRFEQALDRIVDKQLKRYEDSELKESMRGALRVWFLHGALAYKKLQQEAIESVAKAAIAAGEVDQKAIFKEAERLDDELLMCVYMEPLVLEQLGRIQ